MSDLTRADTAPQQRRRSPLSWRAEFGRQLHRRRTYWAAGLTLALPLVIVAAFALGDDGSGGARFVDLARAGSANFAVFVLFVTAQLLLLIIATLFTGDPVPSEASWGSLRYLLIAPISRARLLTSKLVVGLASSLVITLVLPAWSLLVGGLAYGWADFTQPAGGAMGWGDVLPRLLVASLYIFVAIAPCAMLAFWLGVLTDAPLAAVGGAVLASIVFGILDSLDTIGDVRKALPLHYLDSWITLLSAEPDWASLRHGVLWSLLWSLVFGAGAYLMFRRKDVLS